MTGAAQVAALTSLLAALLAVSSPGEGRAASDAAVHDFAQYAAAKAPPGARPPLRLRDVRSRRFRAALADAYDGEVDFAGRYVLVEIGCGAERLQVAALDLRTGAVRWFPASVSGWPKAYPDPLEHRADSRLLIVHGRLGEAGDDGAHAFVFDGRRFSPIPPTGKPRS